MNHFGRLSNSRYVTHVLARAVICGMLLVLPSCGIPPLRPALPGPPLPATFNGKVSAQSSAKLKIEEFFNDPVLTGLIDQGLAANRELKILNEEVQVAKSVVLQRRGTYLPSVGFRGGAELDKPSFFTPLGAAERDLEYLPGRHFPDPLPNFLLSLSLFWRVDIWRELRNGRDAAAQRYLAAIDRRNGFVTRLVADIADNYFALMALDKRLDNLDQIIQLQEQSLKIAKARLESARGTGLAVQRFQAEVRRFQSEKLIVQQDIIETENRINFLLTRFPQPVARLSTRFFDLSFPLTVGVPAQLLENRPDIRRAEREVAASGLDIKVARAHFFPTLDITGRVGYEAFNPKYLFWTPDALIYNIAGEIVAPAINKKAIQAEFLAANARQLESVYDYQRVILNAFTEVVNRVSMVENYGKSIEIKKRQLESLVASVDAATKLFQNPRLAESARVDYLDVLTAQRDLWDARAVMIQTRQQQLSAIVNAYQALGGGWQSRCQDEMIVQGTPAPAPPAPVATRLPEQSPQGPAEMLPAPRPAPEQPPVEGARIGEVR